MKVYRLVLVACVNLTLLYVNQARELGNIQKVIYQIAQSEDYYKGWFDPKKTLMLMVSPDFSGIVSTIVSHALTVDGECMYSDCIHVPDPDEEPDMFKSRLEQTLKYIVRGFEEVPYENFILCEAGVISGRNYTWVHKTLNEYGISDPNIKSIALFENKGSIYKSDFVGEYYDADTQDLVFWWEKPNRAFGDLQFLV